MPAPLLALALALAAAPPATPPATAPVPTLAFAAPGRQGLVGTSDTAGFPRYTVLADGYPAAYDVEGKLLVGFGANGDRYESWLTPASLATELAALRNPPNVPVRRTEKSDLGYFIRGQAVGQEQAVHTAADVPVTAQARNPFAWLPFVGVYENTDVFLKIATVMDH